MIGYTERRRQPVRSAAMDFTWTDEQVELREQAREVARRRRAVRPPQRLLDQRLLARSSPRRWPAQGWIGMTWPTEFGGGGRPPIDRLIVGEELIAAGAPIAAMWFADRQMGPTLIAYGRPDQQARVPARDPRPARPRGASA